MGAPFSFVVAVQRSESRAAWIAPHPPTKGGDSPEKRISRRGFNGAELACTFACSRGDGWKCGGATCSAGRGSDRGGALAVKAGFVGAFVAAAAARVASGGELMTSRLG